MDIIYPIIGAIFGASLAAVFFFVWENGKIAAKRKEGADILEKAWKEGRKMIREARDESHKILHIALWKKMKK